MPKQLIGIGFVITDPDDEKRTFEVMKINNSTVEVMDSLTNDKMLLPLLTVERWLGKK